jgi:alpha-galactosidase
MGALVDYIHRNGLKAGIYSSPGPLTCGLCVSSLGHEEQDAKRWADWGFDYLKYDWCSYHFYAADEKNPAELAKPYALMGAALRAQNRDIVFSLCQYGMGNVWEWGEKVDGQLWRTTTDILDSWASMSGNGFSQAGREVFSGPGRWNDPDMLVVGQLGWGRNMHPSRLTPDEQYTHVSLWCLQAAPLLIGCDLTRLDDFTRSLLTNDEVIAIDQDPLGRPAGRTKRHRDLEVWSRPLEDGAIAVGLFNRGELPATVTASWKELGLSGPQKVRDVWRQKDLGSFRGEFSAPVSRHGVLLVKMTPEAGSP